MAPAIPVFECFIRVTTGDSQRAPLGSYSTFIYLALAPSSIHLHSPSNQSTAQLVSDSFVVPLIAVVP